MSCSTEWGNFTVNFHMVLSLWWQIQTCSECFEEKILHFWPFYILSDVQGSGWFLILEFFTRYRIHAVLISFEGVMHWAAVGALWSRTTWIVPLNGYQCCFCMCITELCDDHSLWFAQCCIVKSIKILDMHDSDISISVPGWWVVSSY